MVNKKVIAALATHLGPLALLVNEALQPDKPSASTAPDHADALKLVWTWSESISTLFWCLTCVCRPLEHR